MQLVFQGPLANIRSHRRLTPDFAGSFSLFGTSGRRDKQVKAHKGAVTALQWNLEGSMPSLLTQQRKLSQLPLCH